MDPLEFVISSLIGLSAIVLAVILMLALSSWLAKTWAMAVLSRDRERYREMIADLLEKLKEETQKKVMVHSAQFETEYTAYREMWAALRKASEASQAMRPVIDHVPSDGSREEILARNKALFKEATESLIDVVQSSRPFLHSAVADHADALIDAIETGETAMQELEGKVDFDEHWNAQKGVLEHIEKESERVGRAIRTRVARLEVVGVAAGKAGGKEHPLLAALAEQSAEKKEQQGEDK